MLSSLILLDNVGIQNRMRRNARGIVEFENLVSVIKEVKEVCEIKYEVQDAVRYKQE